MQIKQQFTINASADKVWEILGHKYAQVAEWASAVHASQERNIGVVHQNAPCSGRICETDLGGFKETITRYDEHGKVVSYTAQSDKMPFFVKKLANTWKVTPLSNDQSRVDMCMEISILPVFNLVMGPMMRMQMGGVSKEVTEELRHFAEKGVPHPRKLESQQKYRLKAA